MIKIIISIAIYALIATGAAVHLGCKTFKPVIIEGQPDECNDFYSVLQYYSVQGGDSAFVGTVYEKCATARRDKKEQEIKDLKAKIEIICYELHGDNLRNYRECVK